jgi:hypothetical protein
MKVTTVSGLGSQPNFFHKISGIIMMITNTVCMSVVGHVPSTYKAIGLLPSTRKRESRGGKERIGKKEFEGIEGRKEGRKADY